MSKKQAVKTVPGLTTLCAVETMNVAPLVNDGSCEVLSTLGASRLTGAVQTIIDPIAIR